MKEQLYYYIWRNMGYTSSCSFTRDKSRWAYFTQSDVDMITNHENWSVYGTNKKGQFIKIEQY
jgi:hypothetical protein